MAGAQASEPAPLSSGDESPAWRRWVNRYAPAEVVGTIAAASVGTMVAPLAGSAAVGIVASWAETIGFYATMAVRDLSHRQQGDQGAPGEGRRRLRAAATTTSALVAEFGPAEVLDTLIVRPVLIAASLQVSSTPLVGIVAGKLLADLVFYIPAIASWELIRRRNAEPARGAIGPTEAQGR